MEENNNARADNEQELAIVRDETICDNQFSQLSLLDWFAALSLSRLVITFYVQYVLYKLQWVF